MPTLADAEYNRRSWPLYAAAVAKVGGEAVAIPLTLASAEIAHLATICQGVLLPGSPADVNPAKYGEIRQPETAAPDVARENADELLLQDAHNLHKPLLAICYGMQSLNTWRTGTLVQHLNPVPVNHKAGASVAIAHSIAIDPDSKLAEIVGPSAEAAKTADFLRLPVNSSHHQAIDIAGDGLKVVARCPTDGVVEAIEGQTSGHFIMGLQWHPERGLEASRASLLIFQEFIRLAAGWHTRGNTESVG
jgi:putative glutamine amidotransferase